jgi:hypothetical protein
MSLATELQAQLDYAALRNAAYTQYGKKLPKTRRAYARRLQTKIRRAQADDLKPRLRYNAQGQPIFNSLAEAGTASKAINPNMFTNAAAVAGRGAYMRRRKRRMGGRGAYYAGQVVGRGAYGWKDLRRAAKSTSQWARKHQKELHTAAALGAGLIPGGSAALAAADSVLASGIGAKVGDLIEGRGAYNSLFPQQSSHPLTEFDTVKSEHGNIIVTGREKVADIFGNDYIRDSNGDIVGSVDAGTAKAVPFTSFVINCTPGNFQQFPKLAQHAANYKEYEWVQLVFTYKSTIPDNYQTNEVNTGEIIMAPEYNLDNKVWTTYGELNAQEQKVIGQVTGNDAVHSLGVECDPRMLTTKGLKNVRTRGLTPSEDVTNFDLARVSFGMFGTSVNLAEKMIGKLYVYYRVHFKTHRMYSMLGYNIPESIKYNNFAGSDDGSLTWNPDGSTDPNPNWLKIFDYSQEGVSRDLCYNNIQFLTEISSARWVYSTGKVYPDKDYYPNLGNDSDFIFDGVQVKLTFPSSLKGNYEISFAVNGIRMVPDDVSTDPDGGLDRIDTKNPERVFPVSTTGTCITNYDFPSIKNQSQRYIDGLLSLNGVRVSLHIHLEQATSTEDNSVTIAIPLLAQKGTVGTPPTDNSTWPPLPEDYDADGSSQDVLSSSLCVKQYNSFQQLGAAGFPYVDSVTKKLVTI